MSTAGISANKLELLQIASAVAQEKSIDKAIVLEAIEEAIQKAARLRYGSELDIRAKLDPTTGEQTLRRVITVVEGAKRKEFDVVFVMRARVALVLQLRILPIRVGRTGA